MSTAGIKRISKYSGLNFNEVMDLPYSYFLLLQKESWIDSYMQSEYGMDILKNLWRLGQTDADMDAIRTRTKKGD